MYRDRVITRTDESGKHDERKSTEFDERMTAEPPVGPGFTHDEAGYGYTCEVWYSELGDPVPDFVE